MYKNTGPKILAIANILAVILILISVGGGIAIWALMGGAAGFFTGLVSAAVGCGLAWIIVLCLAGFGELVSNTYEMLNIMKSQTGQAVQAPSTPPVGTGAEPYAKKERFITQPGSANPAPEAEEQLLSRAFLSMEGGDWEKADELFDQVLNKEPTNAKAYVGKLCAELRLRREGDLFAYESPIHDHGNYKKAVQFADDKYKKTLEVYALTPQEYKNAGFEEKERAAQIILNGIGEAKARRDAKEYMALVSELEKIGHFRNSAQILSELKHPITGGADIIICPLCGKRQRSALEYCFNCGLKLVRG